MKYLVRPLVALVLLGAGALSVLGAPSPAHADAFVVRWVESDILVLPDGSLEVTDTVAVAVGSRWQQTSRYAHPTVRMPDGWGDIEVIDVTREGAPEDWRIEGNNILSSADGDDLADATYVYRFRYRVPNQVDFLGDRERIFWFANGAKPLGSTAGISIHVVLPRGMDIVGTGLADQFGKPIEPDRHIGINGSQVLSFAVVGPIKTGATVPMYIDVAPGTFAPPDDLRKIGWRLFRSNVGVGMSAILAVLGFYAFFFIRGYPRRSKIAQSRRLTPAALRFLHRRRFDATALLAAILSNVANGHASLRMTTTGTAIEPALGRQQAKPLDDEEARVYDRLFRKGEVGVTLSGNADQRLIDAAIVLKSELEARWLRRSPLDRKIWLAIGHAIAVLGVLLVGATSAGPSYGLLIGGAAAFWATAFALFIWFNVAIFRALRRGERGLVFIVAFFAPPVALWVTYQAANWLLESWMLLGLGGIVPILLSFGLSLISFVLLRSRIDRDTVSDRQIDDMKGRLATRDAVRPAAREAEHSELLKVDLLLPYAIALGARHKGFEAVFDAMRGVAGLSPEVLSWQAGDNIDGQMPGFGIAFYVEPPPR